MNYARENEILTAINVLNSLAISIAEHTNKFEDRRRVYTMKMILKDLHTDALSMLNE